MTGVVKIRGVPAVVEETFKHGVYVRGAGRPTVHAFVEDVIGLPEFDRLRDGGTDEERRAALDQTRAVALRKARREWRG